MKIRTLFASAAPAQMAGGLVGTTEMNVANVIPPTNQRWLVDAALAPYDLYQKLQGP